MSQRYIVQASEKPGYWVCTDTENKIVCVFENKRFNGSQHFTQLEDFDPKNFMKLARYIRELSDWLSQNHYSKLF